MAAIVDEPITTSNHYSSIAPQYPTLNYNHPLGVKLTDSNFLIWQQQIQAIVIGHDLEGFLTGEEEAPPRLITDPGSGSNIANPKFLAWRRQDQLLSAWIQSSLSESAMTLVVGLKSAKDVWKALQTSFASQSRAKIMQYRMYLQSLKKESMPMRDYLSKIKNCVDFLNAAGCKVTEEDHILYILTGLGPDYNPLVVTISSKTEAWTVQDTCALLHSFETRLESTMSGAGSLEGSQPSLNLAHTSSQRDKPHFQQSQQHHPGRSDGGRGGFRGGRRGRGGRGYSNRPSCQLCHKPGHMADKCWYRFD